MKDKIHAGSTSVMDRIFIRNTAVTSQVTGNATITSGSAGLTWYYSRVGDTGSTSIALSAATVGTFTSGGFKGVDTVGMPGLYEIGYPNVALAPVAGKSQAKVHFHLRGGPNMEDIPWEVELDAVDYSDSVHFGLTSLPNAAAAASNGLITNGTNAGSGSASMTWNGDIGGRIIGNTATTINGVGANVNVIQTDSVTYKNYDGTVASATGSTVTFPALDAIGNAVADLGQFAYHELEINGGTGASQRVLLTTATGTARQYNVFSGTFPSGADSTSTYVLHDNWRANTIKLGGTDQTARDIGLSVLLSVGVGTGQVNLSSGKVPATLAASDVTGNVASDLQTIKTQTVTAAGAVTFPAASTLASTTNITAGTITTVGTVTSVAGLANNVITAASIATDAGTELAGAIWDLATSGHTTSGSFGAAMVAAGSAGDPWATSLPGSYGAGTAGHLIGTAIPDIAPGAAGGLLKVGSNAATTFVTLTASFVGNVTGNLSGSVGSIATGGIAAASFAAGAVDATAFAQGAADKAWSTAARTLTSTGLDAILVDGKALPTATAIIAAQVGGKISGAGTGTETFIGLNGTTTRAIVTVDSSGNRTAVTYP